MNSILSSTIYHKSENYSSNTPDNFDWKLYAGIVKDPTINSSSSAYKHYKHKCTVNSHNYRLYWRTYYKIPNNFVEESYKKYLNSNSVKFQFNNFEDLYKFYVTKGAQLYPLNDKYSRIHFEIPDDFDSKIYISLYPEAKKENDNQVYHFYHYNKESYPLNEKYYRLKFNTPEDFDNQVYNNRYNFNYNEDTAYQFYKNIGQQSYPLDDTYYRLKYNTPEDFDIQAYNQRYNFNYNITNAYQFYKNIGQNSYPLDDTYYRILYDIPNEFDLDLYKKTYNLDLSPIETYIYYSKNIHCRNLEPGNVYDIDENNMINEIMNINSIDENTCHVIHNYNENKNKNIDLHMDIEENNLNDNNIKTILKIPYDFNYENYNLRYKLDLNEIESYKYFNKNGKKQPLDEFYYRIQYNVPSELTSNYLNSYKKLYPNTIKNNYEITDVFKYYSSVCKSIKDNQLENLELTNNLQKYNAIFEIIDPEIIFKDDIFFYDFIKNKINLKHIYNVYLDHPNSELGKTFIKNYEYLIKYDNYICSEESKRFYFFIREFVDEYFSKSNILIDQQSFYSYKNTVTKTRIVTKERVIKKDLSNETNNSKNEILYNIELISKLNTPNNNINLTDLLSLIDNDHSSKSEQTIEKYDEEESYEEEICENLFLKIPLYTTFYHNIEITGKEYNSVYIYTNITNKCSSYYKLLTNKTEIINKFSKINTSSSNNNICAAVFLNDNYIHNYLSILNNITHLKEVSNLYIFVNNQIKSSEQFLFFTNLILSKNINIHILPISNDFTFNEYNELILKESFWKNFNSDYVILFSTLTIIKNDITFFDTKYIEENYLVTNLFSNNYINSLFSIRNKNYMISLIKSSKDLSNNLNELNQKMNIKSSIENVLFNNFINTKILRVNLEKIQNSLFFLDSESNILEKI
jgi:hypothetical protein